MENGSTRRRITPLAVIAGAMLVALVVMLVIFLWPSSSPKTNVAQNCSGQFVNGKCEPKTSGGRAPKSGSGSNSKSSTSGGSSGSSSQNGSAGPSSQNGSSNSGTSSDSSASQTGSQSLTNTGPGNIIELFLATAALAAVGHFLFNRYQSSKSR